jgi:hypothetical protein
MKARHIIAEFVLRAMGWGAGLGAIFSCILVNIPAMFFEPSSAAIGYVLIYGTIAVVIGMFVGIFIGVVGGFVLSLITIFFANPQLNKVEYRLIMLLTGILITFSISASILYAIFKSFSVTSRLSMPFILFLATIAAMLGAFATQRGTTWYLDGFEVKRY